MDGLPRDAGAGRQSVIVDSACSVTLISTNTRRSVTQVLIPICHAGPETGQEQPETKNSQSCPAPVDALQLSVS